MKDFKYIIIPVLIIMLSQFIKLLGESIKNKKIELSRFVDGMGGMPSSHSAFVTSLTTLIYLDFGADSIMFALSLCFSLIVIYDAMGIRYESGKQAKLLNEITKANLREKLGHKPIEVLVGVILGIILTLGVNLWIR